MSAHVVPKAKSFSESDDDERTTLESQWEDEASTTVEQGEVANKIRAQGAADTLARVITNITSTSAGGLDEPTVDDQHANPAISTLMPELPDALPKLVITQGNDLGQEIEIQADKTYTIGRAVDNDIVLTDIAVSRKHFDLRHEGDAWVIVDRGSGNGTVVNGNIEDNPFMLANGDLIEIGNTVFRFEQPDGAARHASSLGVEVDDEELSTIAGKPLREEHGDSGSPPEPRGGRPKTLPPPAPLRTHQPSQVPIGYPAPQHPASTLPMPQMANRSPVLAPQAPTLLGDATMQPMPGMSPTTIPGQGPDHLAPHLRYGVYPQATSLPPHSVHAQMLVIAQQQGGRIDPSTALVPPTPYNGMPAPIPPRYVQPLPPLTKRMKSMIAAAALSLFAAIVTVAIIKSTGKSSGKSTGTEVDKAAAAGSATKVVVVPIKADPPKADPPKADPPKVDPPKVVSALPKVDPPKVDPPKVDPPKVARTDSPKLAPPRSDPPVPPRADPPKADPPKNQKPPKRPTTPPKPDAAKRVATVDASDALSRADALYKDKRFTEASNLLAAAARAASPDEAKTLRYRSEMYARLGRSYTIGSATGTKPTDAFGLLKTAANSDLNLGGQYNGEIEAKLAQVAPRAAVAYMGTKQFDKAHLAVLEAERLNSSSVSLTKIRASLEARASELYGEASKDADPAAAREKLQQIKNIVDAKSQWYQKATKLLQTLS